MKRLLDIFFLAGAIPILIISIWTTQPFNYYVFLHWYIFLYSIYLIYRTVEGDYVTWLSGIIFSSSTIIFNPFIPFTFSKKTWSIIDLILLLIAFFILAMRIEDYIKSLSEKGKLILKLIKHCFIYSIVIFLMIGFVYYAAVNSKENPYYDFLLITKASIAKGFIIASDEHKDEEKQYRASSQKIRGINIEYIFTTKDGRTIKDTTIVGITEPKYFANANVKPITIEVEYIPSNPKINQIKGRTTHQSIIIGIVIMIFSIGLFVSVFGVLGIRLIKDFFRIFNEIRNEITNVDNK